MAKKKLYVGCSLNDAPQSFVDDVLKLKDQLRDNFKVMDFIGLTDDAPEHVYRWDIYKCVNNADVFLGIFDLPSTGLGYELATAIGRDITILGVAHKDSKISKIPQGAAEVYDNFTFKRYDNLLDDVPKLAIEHLH